MKTKVFEKQQALILRKQGYSLSEISSRLRISKGTASLWLRHIILPKKAQARIQDRSKRGILKSRVLRMSRTRALLDEAAHSALQTLSHIPEAEHLSRLYCSLLYWCEGEKAKNDKSLSFTNSDPQLVGAFLKQLRRGFDLDENKFRVCVHLHAYHNTNKQLLFWSKITNIPIAQFIKPYRKTNSGKNIREGYAGCASVRYYDVRIARQVQALARAFLKDT
ncbi:MAG: helix-turn-helix domain-containing protein [Candidatus Adlerbacteria bacterium]|nr:helix-turn-helix domain-containing protein [Candidatus Adlerbacteria bacterium]